MTLGQHIRKYWHDLYYYLTGRVGVKFALRCQEVAEEIDLKKTKNLSVKQFRIQLHLSICQACKNYLDTSKVLNKTVRKLVKTNQKQVNIEKLNTDLLEKFANQNTMNKKS